MLKENATWKEENRRKQKGLAIVNPFVGGKHFVVTVKFCSFKEIRTRTLNLELKKSGNMDKPLKIARITFFTLVISVIVIEVYCAQLSYENYGWWMPILLYFLIFLNLLVVILFYKNNELFAIILLIILGLLIIPKQLILTHKYLLEREEAGSVTNYVYQQRILTGKFPENLNNYKFKYTELKDDFSYEKDGEKSFTIHFSVGTKSTSHYFMHYSGTRWQYYDD